MKFLLAHKIVSLALSFLVVFSTLSFTVEKHYCGGNLVDVSIFSEVKKCDMTMSADSVVTKKSCCKDEVDVVKGQDDLKVNVIDDLSSAQVLVLQSLFYSLSEFSESLSRQIIPHKDYSPPNLVADIQVLDETYLI